MKRQLCAINLCASAMLFLWAGTSKGTVNKYVEDFTTTQYKDNLNTTAWWDTVSGAAKLYPFVPTLAGSYDTPGNAVSIAIAGDNVFVADGASGLVVIDISDPTNPVAAGVYDTPSYARDVVVAGDHAFVADDYAGLQVIDVSDPTSPTVAGTYVTAGRAFGVAVEGDYAYLAVRSAGLVVIDITDPTSPDSAGVYDTAGDAWGVVISGDYAYVADGTSGFLALDITDPTSPDSAGSYDTPGEVRDLVVTGNRVCLADYSQGLQVIDITDQTSPTLVGSYNTSGYAYGVAVTGVYAYVADGDSGIRVVDISDPSSPEELGFCDTPDLAEKLVVAGDYAFVADGVSGLQVIDIADRTEPSLAGCWYWVPPTYPIQGGGIGIFGSYAIVSELCCSGRIWVLDISNPRTPTYFGQNLSAETPGAMVIFGHYAIVAQNYFGFRIYDIRDPYLAQPIVSEYYKFGPTWWGIAVSGDYVYMTRSGGIEVTDIFDPANPDSVGAYSASTAFCMTISGDYAYLASPDLTVLDISDPTNPSYLGSCGTSALPLAITIDGDYAYLAVQSYGLQVIDISNPTSPVAVGSYDTPGTAHDIAVSGNFAYVADNSSGLHVIDISDPTSPTLSVSYGSVGGIYGVEIYGDYVYTGSPDLGFLSIQISHRVFSLSESVCQSLVVDDAGDDIVSVKLETVQTDSIAWEVSADSGAHWTDVVPGEPAALAYPGSQLKWRSTHVYDEFHVNPSCSSLEIDWYPEYALIDSITDVPGDQGGRVSLTWTRSGHDVAGSATPVTEYAIYRRVEGGPMSSSGIFLSPPGEWDSLTTVSETLHESYTDTVSTLNDSTITSGMYYTAYFVRALTGTPGVYFDSAADSGYSVDNLAPQVPTGFAVAYNTGGGNALSWDACPDADFDYFCVYRDETEDFTPSPGNFVHGTTDTEWNDPVDEGWKYYYKLAAVDSSGNECDAASPGTVTAAMEPVIPTQFALHPSIPNPFNPVTVFSYDVPLGGGKVKIQIFDVGGRLVRTLVDGEKTVGRKTVSWNGRDDRGGQVATGVYFCVMRAPGFAKTMKTTLLK